MILLRNEQITAKIVIKGAELQSLRNNLTDTEYLWSGDADYWGKFSPVLFPIVGGLKNNTYFFKDKEYHLSRHGFARDKKFDVQQTSETEAIFSLVSDTESLTSYPFHFKLNLHYRLIGTKLSCTYEVYNPANEDLLFSIGAHPAFATPTGADLKYTDYYLVFNKDTELICHKLSNDQIDHNTRIILLENGILPLKHDLFYQDALVIKTLKSDCISLKNKKNTIGIDFHFSDFPFFGIWAAKDADFVCLEPWCGIADGIDHDQNLLHKEGIISLKTNENWERTWTVSCY